jgi:outer membrane protein TolC
MELIDVVRALAALAQSLNCTPKALGLLETSYAKSPSLDVLNAQQQRTQVLRDLAQARYALLLSRVRLAALVGQIDETLFAQIGESLQ